MTIQFLTGLLIFIWIMIIASIPKQDTIGCANIKTYPECAKLCTHSAVATCESSVKQRIYEQMAEMAIFSEEEEYIE